MDKLSEQEILFVERLRKMDKAALLKALEHLQLPQAVLLTFINAAQ